MNSQQNYVILYNVLLKYHMQMKKKLQDSVKAVVVLLPNAAILISALFHLSTSLKRDERRGKNAFYNKMKIFA